MFCFRIHGRYIFAVELDVKYFSTAYLFIININSVLFGEIIRWSDGDPFFRCLELDFYIAISSVARDERIRTGFCMYFSSLYRRDVRSSQTKTCCLPSIFLRSRLLVRNSFLFLDDTKLAMVGRGFSLFRLFCPSRCALCISLTRRSISSSSAILNKIFSPSSLSSLSSSAP